MQARVQLRIAREEGIESGRWSDRRGIKIVNNGSRQTANGSTKSKKSRLTPSASVDVLNSSTRERHVLLPMDSKVDYMSETILENGSGSVYEIDRDTWLRINYHAFDLSIRDEKIVELVNGCYNEQTARVFRTVLRFAREREDELRKKGAEDQEGDVDIMSAGGREKSGEFSKKKQK